MDTQGGQGTQKASEVAKGTPRSLVLSAVGIKTGSDYVRLMSAVMSDLIEGNMSPAVGNAICSAGRGILKVVEMQHRYGTPHQGHARVLQLVGDETEPAK